MSQKLSKPAAPKLFSRLRHITVSDMLHSKERIGGIAVTENAVVITYMAPDPGGSGKDIFFQGEIALPAGTIVSGALKNEKALLSALQAMRADNKLSSPSVILSLPHITAQPLVYDFANSTTPEETKNALSLLSSSALPLPQSQIYVDWETMPSSNPGSKRFLLAMGVKELIDLYLHTFEQAGFSPIACETHAWSLPRGLSTPLAEDPSLVCHLTTDGAVFVLYQFNAPVFNW